VQTNLHYLHFHMSKVLFQALPAYHVTYATASLDHPTILISPSGSLFQFHRDSYQISACIVIIIFALHDFCFYR
jgi:hypothetical protein